MKGLAAVAMVVLAAAIGAADARAADRTAKLSDPATTGAAARAAVEKEPLSSGLTRTGLSEVELERIRAAIRGHIRAVTARNADAAFAYLAPPTQDYYANPRGFMHTLTDELRPFANARAFAFAGVSREAADAVQKVVLTDSAGREWIAGFKLARQGDGSWRITRCLVEAAPGPST